MRIVKNPFRRLPVLFFIDGVLAALLIGVLVGAHSEDRLLNELKRRVDIHTGNNAAPAAAVVGAMHLIHSIGPLPSGPAGQLSGYAAFGSYSKALARLLTYCGYQVRIGQMQVLDPHPDSHPIVEAQVEGRWVALDPGYDLVVDPGFRYKAIRYTTWDNMLVAVPVYDLYFYPGLFVFVLLNIYLYRGVRGTLPWQRAALHRMMGNQGFQ